MTTTPSRDPGDPGTPGGAPRASASGEGRYAAGVRGPGELHVVDASARELLAAVSQAVRERRLAEVADLRLLTAWADLHSVDPLQHLTGAERAWARKVGNVLVPVGGEGTPWVQDFALGEIALARGTGVMATRNALADALDLRHRLPRVWAVLESGTAEVWVARKVAKLSRHLSADAVGVVDVAIARIIAREAGGRVIAVAEGKVIEADPDLHAQRVAEEQARRYVAVSRSDEAGLRTVIARVTAGDAVWVKATVDRVAEIIAGEHPGCGADEVRSIAFGWLARPAELLALMLEHTQVGEAPDPAASCVADDVEAHDERDSDGDTDIPQTAFADTAPSRHDEPEPDPDEPHLNRAIAFPADLLDALRGCDLSVLRPKATLYVHLHEATLLGRPGVARTEGLGPMDLHQVVETLVGTQVTLQPVLDLNAQVRCTAYEHPTSLQERVHLRSGGDYWPFATSTSRNVDYDHVTPWRAPDPTDDKSRGAPGQTGTHNSGPLTRRHHRWKTHAGYQARQTGPTRYTWITPNGLAFQVDNTGTRAIPLEHARTILDAPPGIDIDLGPPHLRVVIDPDYPRGDAA